MSSVPTSSSSLDMKYKVAVVGGGPAGACAAEIFAQEKGIDTVLIERKLDNAKPCGGAIPLCMVGEFDLPETVVDRKVRHRPAWASCPTSIVLSCLLFWCCWPVCFGCLAAHILPWRDIRYPPVGAVEMFDFWMLKPTSQIR